MLVFNREDKTWKCENPSDEEVQELLEIGKRTVLQGFGAQFVSSLMSAAHSEDQETESKEPVFDPKLN